MAIPLEEETNDFINGLVDFDYRIFMYCFVCKKDPIKVANDLSIDPHRIHRSCQYIRRLWHFEKVADDIRDKINAEYSILLGG